ncbi:hypothetical protein WI664_11600 [Vibrio cholerae]
MSLANHVVAAVGRCSGVAFQSITFDRTERSPDGLELLSPLRSTYAEAYDGLKMQQHIRNRRLQTIISPARERNHHRATIRDPATKTRRPVPAAKLRATASAGTNADRKHRACNAACRPPASARKRGELPSLRHPAMQRFRESQCPSELKAELVKLTHLERASQIASALSARITVRPLVSGGDTPASGSGSGEPGLTNGAPRFTSVSAKLPSMRISYR